ncbi:MAG: S1 RNA-binding domain-containing protein [Phycisphaeraceae bacterium]|nr:S1 RNA-binding domain-containing protein [Phycisphaeraceae bacterium]
MDPTPSTQPGQSHPTSNGDPSTDAQRASREAAKPASSVIDAQTAAEIDAAMAEMESAGGGFGGGGAHQVPASMPHAKPHIRGPRVVQAGREHRTGTVVSVGPSDLFLEFGPKELGVAPRVQWPDDLLPKVGEDIEVVIDRFEPGESLFICSRPGTVQKAAWEILEIGQVVEARVVGVNKGGLELEVAQHRAFMPASQVALDRINDLSVFVGQKFPCTVSQLDRRGKGNIVLSRRDLLQAERAEKAARLREGLQEGQVVDGVVRKIMPFGAFIDLGGVDGLVHLSDLTHDRANFGEKNVAKHIQEGQQVKVKVLKLDWEANRISLGIKQLAADPFQQAVSDITEGAEVTGRVVRLTDFGAFVELSPGVDGLVHVSEIAHRRINTPGDVLKTDEVIKAKVLKIDPESRRISLSIKATLPAPEPVAGPGGPGGRGGRKGGEDRFKRTAEEIMKDSPQLRRLREKFGKQQFKGGIG